MTNKIPTFGWVTLKKPASKIKLIMTVMMQIVNNKNV